MAHLYRFGSVMEINSAASADAEQLVKHDTIGRLLHETAAILPDNTTIKASDDDSAVCYHKTYKIADPNKIGLDVAWVELGHSNNAEFAGWSLSQGQKGHPLAL